MTNSAMTIPPTARPRRIIPTPRTALMLSLGVIVAVLMTALVHAESQSQDIVAEPAASAGTHAYTLDALSVSSSHPAIPPAVAVPASPETTTTAAPVTTTTAAPADQSTTTTGPPAPVGLYGGSGDQRICLPDRLVAFLMANRDKAAAWVDALNHDPTLRWGGGPSVATNETPRGKTSLTVDDIPAYVAELTSTFLKVDTRVTNHGFFNGRAIEHQSVLQAGTAVLVDYAGVPRARCACGNPLIPPKRVRHPRWVGPRWQGFAFKLICAGGGCTPPPPQQECSFRPFPRARHGHGSDDTAVPIACGLRRVPDVAAPATDPAPGDQAPPPPEQGAQTTSTSRLATTAARCPSGWSGTYPDCTSPAPGQCPTGWSGTYPNCTQPPAACPDGSYHSPCPLATTTSTTAAPTNPCDANPQARGCQPTPACPTGQARDASGQCQPPPCPGDEVRDASGRCQLPPCATAQTRDGSGQCQPTPCRNGQTRDASGNCPQPCPNGTYQSPCPRPCSDGTYQSPCPTQPTTTGSGTTGSGTSGSGTSGSGTSGSGTSGSGTSGYEYSQPAGAYATQPTNNTRSSNVSSGTTAGSSTTNTTQQVR